MLSGNFLHHLFSFGVRLTSGSNYTRRTRNVLSRTFFQVTSYPSWFINRILLPARRIFGVSIPVSHCNVSHGITPFRIILRTTRVLSFFQSTRFFVLQFYPRDYCFMDLPLVWGRRHSVLSTCVGDSQGGALGFFERYT